MTRDEHVREMMKRDTVNLAVSMYELVGIIDALEAVPNGSQTSDRVKDVLRRATIIWENSGF